MWVKWNKINQASFHCDSRCSSLTLHVTVFGKKIKIKIILMIIIILIIIILIIIIIVILIIIILIIITTSTPYYSGVFEYDVVVIPVLTIH